MPLAPPPFNTPPSSSTVTVRVIDSYAAGSPLAVQCADRLRTKSLFLNPPLFWRPTSTVGCHGIHAPDYCFLISNGDRHVLFDLGVRCDWQNYAPTTADLIRRTTDVQVRENVAQTLASQETECGIASHQVEAVIWSHHHFDHIGDPSTFPASTELVVGPGVKASCWPGYPTRPEAAVLDADIEGRTVREIDFASPSPRVCQVGGFTAFDYFGDGSFYLLDAAGHSAGHMCGFARVTTASGAGDSEGDSFVFMGADACHHAGLLRPTEFLPLPPAIQTKLKLQGHRIVEPFLTLSPALLADPAAAQDTVRKIQGLDALDNVFVILAHDESIREHIPLYPRAINDWRSEDLRSKTRWLFCKDLHMEIE
jgi:glyoxylase-like metal-dependent hydrolase (beta-lactamase superfamily II)